jgi:hypothetical protein
MSLNGLLLNYCPAKQWMNAMRTSRAMKGNFRVLSHTGNACKERKIAEHRVLLHDIDIFSPKVPIQGWHFIQVP